MSEISEGLLRKKCKPCEGGVAPMTQKQIGHMLNGLTGWAYVDGMVRKTFRFTNYHETMAFVNASAWISHREDHHPDILVGYGQATVSYMTHAIKGISENDFGIHITRSHEWIPQQALQACCICAAKVDALFDL